MHLGLMNVKGNDDEDDAVQEPLCFLCGPNDCSNAYHHVVVVVVNDDGDDDDDDDNCGNGGGSVGCSGGVNYCKTKGYLFISSYLYNDDN